MKISTNFAKTKEKRIFMCDNYPLGADSDLNAPFNDTTKTKAFEVAVDVTLTKMAEVETDRYETDYDETIVTDTSLRDAYKRDNMPLDEAIRELVNIAKRVYNETTNRRERERIKRAIDGADAWTLYEECYQKM